MGILFVVFLLLFSIFDLIVYSISASALYEEMDGQMDEAEEMIDRDPDGALANFLEGRNIVYHEGGAYVITYRIFLLVRDEEGNILPTDTDLYTEEELERIRSVMRVAILYALGYLYEHREEADHRSLTLTLRSLLFSIREGVV